MEELKALTREALVILRKIDDRTSGHSTDLHQISENMRTMNSIDSNIQRMADTLEAVTNRAMTVLEGKGVVSIKSHLITICMIGVMFILFAVAVTHTSFNAETAGGSKASVSAGVR